MALKEGDNAPAFELLTDEGTPFQLSSLKGRNVVLYWYPKADTPGCTMEACEFRDSFPDFGGVDAVVLGISPDEPRAQAKFKKKYNLPFTLLCDVEHKAAEAYGVWVEKSMYGKKYMGVERTTFVVGKDGRVKRIFSKVKPAGHAGQVLQALREVE
ncbi:MAG: thioredoxin-dependent thiol peroxidase [Bryobacterales bacterium]|nr:thioredoxin-dependent thiol peroxidase [Bryobacterales bacterium]